MGAPTRDVSQTSAEEHLEELERLLDTAGGVSVGIVRQRLEAPHPKYFIGEGKAHELKELAREKGADLAIFDDELSPAQSKNLEELLKIRVMDRTLISWSSFPSDHAALFFGLAAGFFFISLSAGALAMAWALVGVAFARMYLGFHYPSDILGGAVVGVATTLLANVARFRPAIAEPVLRWEADRPRCFYAGMFTFVFLFGTDFGSVSEIVKFGLAVSRHAVFHAQLVH